MSPLLVFYICVDNHLMVLVFVINSNRFESSTNTKFVSLFGCLTQSYCAPKLAV